jgi:tyrosinase
VYEHAIGKLMEDPDPLTNYQRHADFHNVFSDTPPLGCEHRNDLFFPWHRFHLLNFERALQLSDPDHPTLSTRDVTIPYWNWTVPPRTGLRFPFAFENPESRLFNEERNPDPAGPLFSASYMTRLIRETTDWNVFAGGPKDVNEFFGAFESPAHNRMHSTFIGGLMADPNSAAEDPIYWSFHAFIDRIWERWVRVHGSSATCLDCTLRGFPTAPRASDVQRTDAEITLENGATTLGYFYEVAPEEAEPLPRPDTADPRVLFNAMVAAPDRQREVVHLLTRAASPMSFDVPMLDEAPNRAALWLVKLVPPARRSYRIAVFLHPADIEPDAADPAFTGAYYIGEFAFWKAHHILAGQTAGAVLSVTSAFRRYARENTPHLLTFVAEPLPEAGRPDHGHGGHDHGGSQDEPVHFDAVALQVNGNGIPDLVLGEVPRIG